MPTRIRDRTRVDKFPRKLVFYYDKVPLTIASTVNDYASIRSYDYMEDVSTADFKKRSALGAVINSPMRKVVSAANAFAVECCVYYPSGRLSMYESPFHGPSVNAYFNPLSTSQIVTAMGDLDTLSITRAYANVNKSDVEALVSLGELPETLAFLWSPVKGAIELTRRALRWQARYDRLIDRYNRAMQRYLGLPPHIRARRPRPEMPNIEPFQWGRIKVSDIPSLWLAWRYGVRPLLADIENWSKYLQRQLDELSKKRLTARATEEATRTVTWTSEWHVGIPTYRWEHELQLKMKSRAGVLYTPELTWQRQLGLTFDRLPAALYELVPLSFVADWAWNGSQVYDALTAEVRALRISTAWTSHTCNYVYTSSIRTNGCQDGYTVVGGTGLCYVESGTVKKRSPRSLADVAVRLRIRLDAQRVADGLALLSQLLKGR